MKQGRRLPSARRRVLFALAGIAVAAAVAYLLRLRRGPAPAHVLRLPVEGLSLHRLGGDTRPASVLDGGRTLTWDLPGGPPRVFRTAFYFRAAPGTRAQLRVSVHAPGESFQRSLDIAPAGDAAPSWRDWEVELPAIAKAGALEISFSGNSPDGSPAALLLGQPALSPAPDRPARLTILFLVDTLRKDHVSAFGYGLPTTPTIARFFAKGLAWPNCFANSPWTLASHATIFTSTPPSRHGVGERRQTLPDELPVLAELLAQAGYRTLAVTSGGYVDPDFGFARGFDVYRVGKGSARDRVREALELLDRYRGEPVFLFFHTYQVHEYAADESSARELFGSTAALGPGWDDDVRKVFARSEPPRELARELRNRYDGAIRSVDGAFGDLEEGLRQRGLLDFTAVWFTSDHGEEIFDRPSLDPAGRGSVGHLHPYLYEEYLSVPLLARVPWWTAKPVPHPENVSLLDLAPTLLQTLSVPPPATFEGRSLFAGGGAEKVPEQEIVAKAPRYDALAVRRGLKKIIVRSGFPFVSWEDGTRFGELPSRECFDLAADPGERSPGPCDAPWGAELVAAAEKALTAGFPGSIVLHFSGAAKRGGAREFAVRALGRGAPPEAFAFGAQPVNPCWIAGDAAECRFSVNEAPAWIAFRPERPSGALQLELYGAQAGEIRSVGPAAAVGEGDRAWTDLRWDPRVALPEGIRVFATAPGDLVRRSQSEPSNPEVMERLRSLGYLSAGGGRSAGVSSGAVGDHALPELADGVVRLIRAPAPQGERWPRPAPPPVP